jgi:hypothetical protein
VFPAPTSFRKSPGDRQEPNKCTLHTHRERFTLGLDTLAGNDPPTWLDLVAYGIAIAIALALVRAVIRSLNRLGAEPLPEGMR